jgi:hypothetical protein
MLTAEQRVTAALLVLILKDECATNSMMHALTLAESLVGLPGTPECREAFATAHVLRAATHGAS